MTLTSLLNSIVYQLSLLGIAGIKVSLGLNSQENVLVRTLHKTNTIASNPTSVDVVRTTRRALVMETGFTIIEVLIVLAIAGLIMLIVFLAIPALQRNNRNTARRSDIAKMIGAINEYRTNNIKPPSDQTTLNSALANANYGFYTSNPVATYKTGSQTNPNNDSVWVVFRAICGTAANLGNATSNSNQRAVAILYSIEGPGGSMSKACQNR